MGTSGSYGGSNKQSWRRARQAIQNSIASGGDVSGPASPTSNPTLPATDLQDIFSHVGDALFSDDNGLRLGRAFLQGIGAVMAAGTALAGAPYVGRRTPVIGSSTASGGRSNRAVLNGAARTGTALGAGFALRDGNQAALDGLGLDIAQLNGLSPIEQTQRIVDQVFGAAGDEIEYAGREAAAVILLAFLDSDLPTPDYARILREGVAEFVYRRAIIELSDQLTAGVINHEQSVELQKQMRDYVRDLVVLNPAMNPADGVPSAETCSRIAAEATVAAINTLRGGTTDGSS